MYYDFSLSKEQIKKSIPYDNNNKNFFLNENINTLASVGHDIIAKKFFIPNKDRFDLVNDQLYIMNDHFTQELNKIKEYAENYDKKYLELYDEIYELNRLVVDNYLFYMTNENEKRMKDVFDEFCEYINKKFEKQAKMMKYIFQLQSNFKQIQVKITNLLDKIENNQNNKLSFLYNLLVEELESYDLDGVRILSDEELKELKKKLTTYKIDDKK
jgi:hypothetical protein